MEDLAEAIEALQRARETKLAELKAIERALEALGVTTGSGPPDAEAEFEHLGIVSATKRYLSEEDGPRTTREIANALQTRGLKTKSKNFVATVYATLDKASNIRRTNDGRWELRESSIA